MDKVQKDQPPCRETSFEYVRDSFLLDRQSEGVSKRTLRIYSQELGYFKKFLDGQGVLTIEGVSAQVARQYLNELSTHRNPGGCHIAYRVLKTFTYWWEQELDGDYTSPMRKVKSPRLTKELLPPADRSEIRQMLDACDGPNAYRDKAILYCLLDSGCRASEFLSVNLDDLDINRGSIHVKYGKGGKDRVVYIGKPSRKALRGYLKRRLDSSPALWVTRDGSRLTYFGLRQVMRRAANRAGLKKEPSLHSFRRAFVVAMLRKRVSLITLRNLMGHADLRVLERYANQNDAELRKAYDDGSPSDLVDDDI